MLEALTAPGEHGGWGRENGKAMTQGLGGRTQEGGERAVHRSRLGGGLWTQDQSGGCFAVLEREGEGAIRCLAHSPSGMLHFLKDQTPALHEPHRAPWDLVSAHPHIPSHPAMANFP